MATVARLSADFSINTSRLEVGLERAKKKLAETERAASSLSAKTAKAFSSVGNGVGNIVNKFNNLKSAIVAVATAGGLGILIKSQINFASALKDTSDRLQISTDALQVYQYAASQAGISNEALETGLTKLNAKIADGSLKYSSVEAGMMAIAEAVKNAKTGVEKLAIANDQFGAKIGAKMLPLLLNGAQGLRDFELAARNAGGVISADLIEKTDKLGDQLDTLGVIISRNFSSGFLSQLTGDVGQFSDLLKDPAFGKSLENFGELLGVVAKGALAAVAAIGYVVGKVKELSSAVQDFNDKQDVKMYEAMEARGNTKMATKMRQKAFEARERIKDRAGGNAGIVAPAAPIEKFSKSGKSNDDTESKTKSILDGLESENIKLAAQARLYGIKETAMQRVMKGIEIANQLHKDGIKLTKDEQAAVSKQLELYQQNLEILEKQKKEMAFVQSFTGIISSGFEDAIVNGGKLSDVFGGLLQDIQKLILKQAILAPLFGSGAAGDQGILGGLFASIGKGIFGSFSSHATGQANVPYDMMARLHKGERVVPAQMNKNSGSGDVILNVINKTDGQVSARQKSGTSMTEIEMMIDKATAKNMSKKGSSTNQAMGSFTDRTLVRR